MNEDTFLAMFTGLIVGASGFLFGFVGLNNLPIGLLIGLGLLLITTVGIKQATKGQSTMDYQDVQVKQKRNFKARLLTKDALIFLIGLLLLGLAGAGITLTGI